LCHPYSVAYALYWAACLYKFLWERPAVQERVETLLALASEQGFPLWVAHGTVLRGWALAEQGHIEEGIAQIQEGLAVYRATGSELYRPYYLALLAEAYGKVGQTEEGLSILAEALALVDKTGECCYETELYRLKGELTLQSKVKEAEECFLKAIELARRQQAKSLELRATVSLSRLWQSQGKKAEAHKLLSKVYYWFTEGFDTLDLKEAKALLESLESGV
jgi:predicted ATPase